MLSDKELRMAEEFRAWMDAQAPDGNWVAVDTVASFEKIAEIEAKYSEE